MTDPNMRPHRLHRLHQAFPYVLSAIAAAVLAGCSMIPAYERPAAPVAAAMLL